MNAIDAMIAVKARPRTLLIKSARDAENVLVEVQDSGNGLDPRKHPVSSTPSSPPSQKELEWDCRSAVPSSKLMADACKLSPEQRTAQFFKSSCPRQRSHDRSAIHRVRHRRQRSCGKALDSLIRSVGYGVETFSSAKEFPRAKRPEVPSCLILDIRLKGISGLDFQSKLARTTIHSDYLYYRPR